MDVRQSAFTDSSGNYSFPELAVGVYDLQVDAPGFKLYTRTNISLDASSSIHVDVSLAVGERSDTVAVVANAAHVETADTTNGGQCVFPDRPGVYQRNQLGGLFGGPIARNKVFFFADYQGTRLS
jgi:hypothetical protein